MRERNIRHPKRRVDLAARMNGERYYSTEDVQQIISATPVPLPQSLLKFAARDPNTNELESSAKDRRYILRHRLELAAVLYATRLSTPGKPPSGVVKDINRIIAACTRVSAVLSAEAAQTPDSLPDHILCAMQAGVRAVLARMRASGNEEEKEAAADFPTDAVDGFRVAVRGLKLLRDAAIDTKAYLLPLVGSNQRNPGDEAMQEFIRNLMFIFQDVFERQATVTIDPKAIKSTAGGPFIAFCQAAIAPLGLTVTPDSLSRRIKTAQETDDVLRIAKRPRKRKATSDQN